jgi:hypothetical protein
MPFDHAETGLYRHVRPSPSAMSTDATSSGFDRATPCRAGDQEHYDLVREPAARLGLDERAAAAVEWIDRRPRRTGEASRMTQADRSRAVDVRGWCGGVLQDQQIQGWSEGSAAAAPWPSPGNVSHRPLQGLRAQQPRPGLESVTPPMKPMRPPSDGTRHSGHIRPQSCPPSGDVRQSSAK